MAIALDGDLYVPVRSPIHRWAVRPKLVSLLVLIFACALVRHLLLLPAMLAGVALLYGVSRLPGAYLRRRLPYPGLFIISMVGILPWISGSTVLWQWGWLSLRLEGLQAAGLIAGRFLTIVITGFVLLGTTPFLDILKALRSLGLPPLLADMGLLTYRYLYDVAAQLAAMQQAMRLRGYGLGRQTLRRRWRWLASLLGTLLLRSYERSQRVYKAMRLRGYGQTSGKSRLSTMAAADSRVTRIATPLTLAAAVFLVIAELYLSHL